MVKVADFHLANLPDAGSGVVRMDPLHFLAGFRKRTTKPGSVCHSWDWFLCVFFCAVYYGQFLCIVSLRFYVFCLLVVLVKLSVLSK